MIKITGRILSATTLRCVSSLDESKDVRKIMCYNTGRKPYQIGIKLLNNYFFHILHINKYVETLSLDRFKANSYRGASLSRAYNKNAHISEITKPGNWKKSSTFFKNCFAFSSSSTIGNFISESQR